VAPRSRSGSRPGRALAGLAVLVLIMLFSITGSQTFNPGNWHNQFKVALGLDLSSGTEVVLQAATPNGTAPSSAAMQQAVSVLLARVNGTGNSGAQVQTEGANLINVTIPGKPSNSTVDLLSSTARLAFRPVYLEQAYAAPAAAATPSASPSAKASGTGSPSATPTSTAKSSAKSSATTAPTPTAGASASTTASPKASTQAEAAALASPSATPTATATSTASAKASTTPKASATAKASATPTPTATSTAAASTAYGNPSLVNAATQKLFNKLVCKPGPNDTTVDDDWKATVGYTPAADQWDDTKSQIVSCDPNGTKYVLGPATFEGPDITSSTVGLESGSTQWVVSITLNSGATKAWGTLTTNQYNNYFPTASTSGDDAALDSNAVVLDGDVQVAPETQTPLTAGSFQITGPQPTGFTQDQATNLNNVLKYGQLPLNFTLQNETSISPQIGHSSLDAGLIAAIIGLGLVIIYLFYYYRGLGIVSVSSLLLAALLAYFSVVLLSKYQNFTMSLSAIAGLVVAIGITADSFIVYFERLRDEVRDGKTLRPAVEAGWKRARRTILVSDTVSFIAAVLLYHFAVSDVQGFAYTLGLTTIIDVIVVFLFTKPMVTLLAGTKFFSGGNKWSGLDPERLGAKTRWRASTTRTVRSQRTTSRRPVGGSSTSSSTSREA
jgi:preprotein translocase subunit SecD